MKTKIILMNNGRMDYSFDTEMIKPKINEIITITGMDGDYVNYKIKEIQHFINPFGIYQYLMITAIR